MRVRLSVANATDERVERAPALVAVEQLPVAEVEAEPGAFDQHLGQRGDVAEAEVEALARDRVDGMRRVADQRQAVGGDLRRVMEAERKGRARREHFDLAEEAAHRRLGLGREILVVRATASRPHPRPAPTTRSPTGVRPHRRSSAAVRTARSDRKSHRRHGRAAARGEAPRRSPDDRTSTARRIPAASRVARIAAVGGDQQRRVELAPVLQRDTITPCSPRSTLGDSRLPQQPHVLARLGARLERGAQVAVLVHPAERLIVVGIEMQPSGLSPSATAMRRIGQPGCGRCSATPIVSQHPHRAR